MLVTKTKKYTVRYTIEGPFMTLRYYRPPPYSFAVFYSGHSCLTTCTSARWRYYPQYEMISGWTRKKSGHYKNVYSPPKLLGSAQVCPELHSRKSAQNKHKNRKVCCLESPPKGLPKKLADRWTYKIL